MRNTKICRSIYISAHAHVRFNSANLASQAKPLMPNLNQAFLKHQDLVELKNPKLDGEGRRNPKNLEKLLESAHCLNKKQNDSNG